MPTPHSKTPTLVGLVLFVAAALTGAWWLLRQGSSDLLDGGNPGAPAQVTPDSGAPAAPDLVPMDLTRDPKGTVGEGPGRESAPGTGTGSGEVVIAAVDALTGDAIPRFWAKRSGAGEIGRETERFQAGPGETRLAIDIGDPPGLLTVLGAKYAPKEIRLDRPGFLRVELDRSTSIVGTVRDGTSAVVPGARVTLERQVRDPESSAMTWGPPKDASLGRTDKEGQYAFSNLPPGTYRTSALAGTVSHTSDGHTVKVGEWTTIDHWLSEDGTLSVELVRPDGSPSAKSRIMLGNGEAQNGEPILARYTDESGRAVLGPLERGTYELTVLSDHGTLKPVSISLPLEGAAQDGLRLELQPHPQDD